MPVRRPRLGQHFLRDAEVLCRIAAETAAAAGRSVVEIGPGEGVLTELLLAKGSDVTAVELDERLADALEQRFGENPRFRLIRGDILKTPWPETPDKLLVVGNLPYYITSPIVRKTLSAGDRVEEAVFLVQKEVGQRICAAKGSRDYGFLSALCRLYAEPRLAFAVKPGSFEPPPKVDSAVVALTLRPGATIAEDLLAFLEAAFRSPRKTLRNNLSALYPKEALDATGRSHLRAQQLDVDELQALWGELSSSAFTGDRETPAG